MPLAMRKKGGGGARRHNNTTTRLLQFGYRSNHTTVYRAKQLSYHLSTVTPATTTLNAIHNRLHNNGLSPFPANADVILQPYRGFNSPPQNISPLKQASKHRPLKTEGGNTQQYQSIKGTSVQVYMCKSVKFRGCGLRNSTYHLLATPSKWNMSI